MQLQHTHWLCMIATLCVLLPVQAQFWKLNIPSERDSFILETKSRMASGICYKLVPGKSNDPTLSMQTISYCCRGYQRNTNSMAMQCDPICTEDCTNGICTAPDVCECYPGYGRLGGRCEAY